MTESTNQHLNRAFELLKEIDFSKIISSVNWGEYSLDNGNLQCKVLFREAGAEVMHCVSSPGCKTEPHKHEQREHYLLYEGKAQMVTEDKVIDKYNIERVITAGTSQLLAGRDSYKIF